MKSVNPNMYPKDGYFFKENDGARIFGDTWAGVIKRVVLYRRRAGYPPGDPAAEVTAQACARNPVLCQENDNTFLTKRAPLKSRILTWLNGERANKNRSFVPEPVAKARAQVCATCPKNNPIPEGCSSCRAAVKQLRESIIERRFQDGRLNACTILGEDLPTSVHLESQTVDNGELPGHCWRRRSL